MADLETLTLRITEESSKAYSAIDKLAKRLDGLSVAVAKLEVGKLNDLARGLVNLNSAIILIKGATSQADYTRIFQQLSTLGNVDTNKMNNLAASLGVLSNALANIPTTVGVTTGIKDLVATIGKLGGVNIQKAITNIPQLEKALTKLIKSFSSLPQVNQNIIDFINSLTNLASQGQKIGSASTTITNSLDRFSSSAVRATRRSHSLASTIGTLYAKFWLLIRGAKGLKNAFTDAADYLEAYNYFDVTAKKIGKDTFAKAGVGSAEQYTEAFTKTLEEKLHKMSGLELDLEERLIKTTNAKSLGLNLTELTQYQASLASITNAMGVSQEVATSTAKAFSMLAGDMGSLKNMDFTQVAQKLQSGLAGQARALYQFGIDITNATLAEYAYANGITKAVSEMSQAEKAQLRLLAILDQSKVSWGDLANTINSPSNQLRMLKTNLKEVGTVMGQLFIPIMQSVLPVLNGLSMALKQLFVDIAEILGIKRDLESFGTFGDEVDADVESVEDLNKAMKETKKSIREFDELKVINNGSDRASSIGDEIDLTKEILQATAEYEKVWEEAYAKMQLKAEEISKNIGKALAPIKKIIKDFKIGDFLSAGKDVSGLITSITNFVTEAITSVDWKTVGTKIGEFFKGIDWAGIFAGFGNLLAGVIQAAINLWSGSFTAAPFETALIAAFMIMKFTGLGKIVTDGLKSTIVTWFTEHGVDKDFLAKAGVGAISVALGLSLMIDNINDVQSGENLASDLSVMAQAGISSLLMGAGFTAVAAALGVSGFTGLGLVFVAGVGLSLLFNYIAVKLAEPKQGQESELDRQKREWAEKVHLDTMEVFTNITIKEGKIDAQFNNIDFLATKVLELSESFDSLTESEKAQLQYYSGELVKIMPEVASQIDEVTGAYKGSREELEKLIETQKAQITMEASRDILVDLEKRKFELEKDYNTANDEIKANIKKRDELAKKLRESGLSPEDIVSGRVDIDDIINPLDRDNAREFIQTLKWLNSEQYDANQQIVSDWNQLNEKIDYYTDKYETAVKDTYTATAKDTKDGLDATNTKAEDGTKKVGKTLTNGAKSLDGSFDTLKNGKLPTSMQTALDNVNTKITNNTPISKKDMKDLYDTINNSFDGMDEGEVPKEMKSTMDAIEKAIEDKSPELVNLMESLKTQLQTAFSGALTFEGELFYNKDNTTVRLINKLGKLKEAEQNGANGDTSNLTKYVYELFASTDKYKGTPADIVDILNNKVLKTSGLERMNALNELENAIVKKFQEIGLNIPLGLSKGVWDGSHYYYKAIEGISENGEIVFKKDNKISSPSKLYRDDAKYIPEGIALGITDGIPKVDKAMRAVTDNMQSEFGGMKINVPRINFGAMSNTQRFNYNNMDSSNAFVNQLLSMANAGAEKGQTEVVFRIEGDPYGMFKVVREENDKYKRMHTKSAFT